VEEGVRWELNVYGEKNIDLRIQGKKKASGGERNSAGMRNGVSIKKELQPEELHGKGLQSVHLKVGGNMGGSGGNVQRGERARHRPEFEVPLTTR